MDASTARLTMLLALLAYGCGSTDAPATDAGSDGPLADGPPAEAGPRAPMGTSLLLQVSDTAGVGIAAAAVFVAGEARPTDGAGRVLLEELMPGRVVARVAAPGYAPASVVVELDESTHAGLEVQLHPLGPGLAFDAADGAVLERGAVRVSIPAHALVDYNGEPVSGMVEATLVGFDPAASSPAALPGPLVGADAEDGAEVNLESLGMAEVSLWQNGLPVHLAPGVTATLELALSDTLAGRVSAGERIPAWWLDETAGIWREEGAGIIQASTSDPERLAWVAEVGHFTWWNCDRPWTEKTCFAVTVIDEEGTPLRNMLVGAQGVSYAGRSSASFTRAAGEACVDIMHGGEADLLVGSWLAPLVESIRVSSSGPAGDCAGQGAACTPITITVPRPLCVPGTSVSCPYSGPLGTEGVGICQAAARYCNVTGTAWSDCIGEVLPAPETCATIFDDDCDGEANEADGLGCACGPGDTVECYSGPPETLDVGICQAGVRACNSLIGQLGPCVGEVLPREETCETEEDDDCDGSNECQALGRWASALGPGVPTSLVVDGAGQVLVSIMVGESENLEVSLRELDASGMEVASIVLGDASAPLTAQGMAVDAERNILVTGSFSGTVNLGGGPLTSEGGQDIYIAKLDASGAHVWSRRFGDWQDQRGMSLAVDAAGNVLVVGYYHGTVNFGGGALPVADPSPGIFVVKLAADGTHLWSRGFARGTTLVPYTIAVDAAGDVVIAGSFFGTTDFGGGPLNSAGDYDIFVAKLDAAGNHVWSRRFGGGEYDYGWHMAVDATGHVLLTGWFQETVDFGNGPLTSAGSWDIFVVKLDSLGNSVWSRRYGDHHHQMARSIAVDPAGNVVIAGYFFGTVDFGGGPLMPWTWETIFVAKLDGDGNHVWSRSYGNYESGQLAYRVTTDADGEIFFAGWMAGTIDFGSGPLYTPGGLYVVKLSP